MRYTTLIDISEIPKVYRNKNACLLYVHMALKAGYHADDLDTLNVSLRALAMGAGLTLSATRHALHVLEDVALITRHGDAWTVKKWLIQEPAKKRPATSKEAAQQAAAALEEEHREDAARKVEENAALRLERWASGTTSWCVAFEQRAAAAARGDEAAREFCDRQRAEYERQKSAARAAVEQFVSDYNKAHAAASRGDETARRWLARNAKKADVVRAMRAREKDKKTTT